MNTLQQVADLLQQTSPQDTLKALSTPLFKPGETVTLATLIQRLQSLPDSQVTTTVTPLSGTVPLMIAFSHSCNTPVLSVSWFVFLQNQPILDQVSADGNYTLKNPGDYLVKLYVTTFDSRGPQSRGVLNTVHATAPAPPPLKAPPASAAILNLAIANPVIALQAGEAKILNAQWSVIPLGGGASLQATGLSPSITLPSYIAPHGQVVIKVQAQGVVDGEIENIIYNGVTVTTTLDAPPTINLLGASTNVFFRAEAVAISDQAGGDGVLFIPLIYSGTS